MHREQIVIDQGALKRLEDLQRLEWLAARQAGALSERIRYQIEEQHAIVEDGPLYWDAELRMVRTRKAAAG